MDEFKVSCRNLSVPRHQAYLTSRLRTPFALFLHLPPHRSKDTFEKGQMDEFKVSCRNLGVLRAIRIESDGRSAKPNWHLDRVVIIAPSGETYFFLYGDWIMAVRVWKGGHGEGSSLLPPAGTRTSSCTATGSWWYVCGRVGMGKGHHYCPQRRDVLLPVWGLDHGGTKVAGWAGRKRQDVLLPALQLDYGNMHIAQEAPGGLPSSLPSCCHLPH